MTQNYRYFAHRSCEYFPCHEGADPENFNCLFCWCPLYALGKNCGGNFRITSAGVKDCTACLLPHRAEHYDLIVKKFSEIQALLGDLSNDKG